MKIHLTLGLLDRPGQLVKALEPIAKSGGNIVSIIHERERLSGGYVPVSLVVDFLSAENLERTKNELSNRGIPLMRAEELIEKSNLAVLLVGQTEVKNLISIIESEDSKVMNYEVSAPTSKEPCVRLEIEAPAQNVYKIQEKLREATKREGLILISSW
ncbi:MAG: ACT domain-containing protein [Nitrososphaeria archaeon]|nr:ACT domain-containing protein [Nitrososphaeria archaeon]NIN52324.1 ACT domain-containing protein [Nitrososphaeria archaeon]NIQ32802.1 ACT domain-containing protein [Nitrososphaeria archaeon]